MYKLNEKWNLKTPSAKVLAVAVCDDGLCAAGDRDGVIHIIDTQTGESVRKLKQHVEFVYAMDVDPDSGHLITTGKDKSLREWDVKTGAFICDHAGIFTSASARTMGAQSFKASTRSHTKTVTAVVCAAGKMMATGGQDSRVKYWKDGEPLRSYEWHEGPIACVRFQPNTNILFSASKDKSIRSWNIDNGAMLHKYLGHTDEIVSFAFDGENRFVSVDISGSVRAWNADSEICLGEICRVAERIQSAAFDAERHLLVLGTESGKLIGINVECGDRAELRDPDFTVSASSFAIRSIAIRDGLLVAGDNDGHVCCWNIES